MNAELQPQENRPWYDGVTRYQWLVLVIASLGWIFDVFEGQIFVASMNEAMPSLLPADAPQGAAEYYNNLAFGFFLLGGALGGVVFGTLSDRIGRTRTMVYTILMYACFTAVTAFAQTPWQMVLLRFLVAMGVGGEWAVASAMVAEVMPARARARLSGVFHASSVFGTYLATAAGMFIVRNTNLKTEQFPDMNWRLAFLVGAIPALLIIWVRLKLREPDQWIEAQAKAKTDSTKRTGRVGDLFKPQHLRGTLVGVTLAAVGMATFWGVHIYGKDLMRSTAERPYAAELPEYLRDQKNENKPRQEVLALNLEGMLKLTPQGETREEKLAILAAHFTSMNIPDLVVADDLSDEKKIMAVLKNRFESIKGMEMLGMLLTTTGGGLGLLLFGPLCERIGRRKSFLLYHLGGLVVALVLFQVFSEAAAGVYWVILPIFGFLTLGMHAGYAIYFPELFPTRMRGTGGGFCFNVGRVLAAPILFLSGWMQKDWGYSLPEAASLLSCLYLVGMVILIFAPETKDQDLPE